MKYTININYDTGDSFHSEYDVNETLDISWENIEIAKENLKRIQDHYNFVKKPYSYEYRGKSNKEIEEIKKNASKQPWFVSQYPEICLYLKLDDGKKFQQSSFWSGYFEKLNYIEIVVLEKEENDLRIDF
jgi:hypothetical protein